MEEFTIKKIPREKRIRNTSIALIVTVGFTVFALWTLYSHDQFGENVFWVLLPFLVGLFVSFHYWRTTEVKELTPEAKEQKQTEETQKTQKIEKEWAKIINGLGIVFVLAGPLIVGWQIYIYLKHGEWVELPLLFLAAFGPEKFVSWLSNPSSWFGLHKLVFWILKFFPVSLFSLLLGYAMMVYEPKKTNA